MQRWTMVFTTRKNRKTVATAMRVKLLKMEAVPRRLSQCMSRTYSPVLAESSLNPSWVIYLNTTLKARTTVKISFLKKTASGANWNAK